MKYPELTFTAPATTESRLTPGTAAKLASSTEHLLNKLIRAQYVES